MRSIPSPIDFLRNGTRTAQYFGFRDLDDLRGTVTAPIGSERMEHRAKMNDRRTDALHGMLTSGVCAYFDHHLYTLGEPSLFYTTTTVPRTGETALALHIVGVPKSIAESILIQTTRALLEDLGYENAVVRINSLGDQESITRYIRELTNFLRRRIDELPAPARELMKEHVFNALMYLIEKEDELALRSPSPLEYLSDQSRRHFREIVEFLDLSAAPYEIDGKLLGHHQCYSDAIFSFDLTSTGSEPGEIAPLYVRGGRYNTFATRVSKHGVPAAGAVVVLRGKKAPTTLPRNRKRAAPSVFVVQLGAGPKMRSLMLIHELKRAGISVYQDIPNDSLSGQLQKAEGFGARYAVIIGQKEFVEGNVILRNLEARSQEQIPLTGLTGHLRRVVRR